MNDQFSTQLINHEVINVLQQNLLDVTTYYMLLQVCGEKYLISISFRSLDKITYTSGGKYECVFLTEPEVKQTIEVKSKFMHDYYRCPYLHWNLTTMVANVEKKQLRERDSVQAAIFQEAACDVLFLTDKCCYYLR